MFNKHAIWFVILLAIPLFLAGCAPDKDGFCVPGATNVETENGSGTGSDCDQAKALELARADFGNKACTGIHDPLCPKGCKDENKTCSKYARSTAGSEFHKQADDPKCAGKGGVMHTYTIVGSNSSPVTCGCKCL